MGEHQMNAVFDELKRVCEKLAASEAEIATLKASRAVAVEQEQASRNEANRLRAKCEKLRALASKLAGFVPCSLGTEDLLDEIQEVLHQ